MTSIICRISHQVYVREQAIHFRREWSPYVDWSSHVNHKGHGKVPTERSWRINEVEGTPRLTAQEKVFVTLTEKIEKKISRLVHLEMESVSWI